MNLNLSDYVGTLMVNLSALRRENYDAYVEMDAEWRDMLAGNEVTIESVVELENRVIDAVTAAIDA